MYVDCLVYEQLMVEAKRKGMAISDYVAYLISLIR